MRLNSKFDVLRGWPKEGAIDTAFPIHATSGTPDTLPPGMVVALQSDGSVAAATTVNRSTTNGTPTWVVVEGNDDFSAQFVGKVNCIRKNAVLRLDPANFNAGSYAVGSLVTFSSGKWQLAVTNNQVIGEVIEDDRATDGTLVVYYDGGFGAML
jgi:hypothetical protein